MREVSQAELRRAWGEPEAEVVLRSKIPRRSSLNVDNGFWDAVVRRLALLKDDEVLKIAFSGDQITSSMKSSLHTAAGRAGVNVSVLERGNCIYTWIRSHCEPRRRRQPRMPFPCQVCGKRIVPPPTGATVQYVCRPTGTEIKSWCYRVRRLALNRGISFEEADQYLRDWHIRQKGGRVAA